MCYATILSWHRCFYPFVSIFKKNMDLYFVVQIRSALEAHFGSCGDISRVSIPKDFDGNVKGFVLPLQTL